jgi:FKBP-type peptidyl-prolyl cis-trans isomerase SlyD
MQVKKNSVVSIFYVLKDDKGQILDQNEANQPLVYLHGCGQLLPALESKMEGAKSGDKIVAAIEAKNGYGEYDKELVFEVKRSDFPADETLEPGMQFHAHNEDGTEVITIVKIEGDKVTVDANHPLAGQGLNFDVTITDVREATPQELEHGHVHGDGHDH